MKNNIFTYPIFILFSLVISFAHPIAETKVNTICQHVKTIIVAAGVDTIIKKAKAEVPVLCYHQIRNWLPTDSKNARPYIMPPSHFEAQMKVLASNNFHCILPDQLMAYLENRHSLPSNPVMISFDDGTESQITDALPILNKYNFKAVFYIMTVVLNRPRYITTAQVKMLADNGHTIGCHTWNHEMVTKYTANDWNVQLEKPTAFLEKITGKPIKNFAYPNGIWSQQAIEKLKKEGYYAAFQLAGKRDGLNPNYSIRRIIVNSSWNDRNFLSAIKTSFQ